MIIPSKLKIGGHIVKVRCVQKVDEEDSLGWFERDNNTIKIKGSLSQSQKESVFIHEIMHVLNTTIEHDFLDSFAEQIYQVLSDNNLLK